MRRYCAYTMWSKYVLSLTNGRMDDVEDNSELRRGIPVAHHIYGIPQTINTANYVYFLAVQELISLSGPGGKEMGFVTGK
jgi:geranylgeranyl pyrophosphate synthase